MKICESRVPKSTQRRTSLPTASALVVRDGNPNRKIYMDCVYCKADHYSASCETVNTIPARMEALRKRGRCFLVWLLVTVLPSNRRCRKCNRKHHQSLCDQSINLKETSASSEGNSNQDTTVAVSRSKVQVLLQTAQTYAYTANNELVPNRIIMDDGSQRSYVSNQLKMRLKLNLLGQEQLTNHKHIWK